MATEQVTCTTDAVSAEAIDAAENIRRHIEEDVRRHTEDTEVADGGVGSVPAASEGISVNYEKEVAKVNAIAIKMNEALIENSTAAAAASSEIRLQSTAKEVYPNLNGVPKATSEDAESILCRFGWTTIGPYFVPYILRIQNGKKIKYVSERIVNTQVLSHYLSSLSTDITDNNKCASFSLYLITANEAEILNRINLIHCDQIYGRSMFVAEKDYIYSLDDLKEYYLFLSVCFNALTNGHQIKCGFIRFNSESIVSYTIEEDKKYVPIFYFEGQMDELMSEATTLKRWKLAYLKFCFKVQGIRENFYDGDSCFVVSLDEIKTYFEPSTVFEDIWPSKVVQESGLLNDHSNAVKSVTVQKINNIQPVPVDTKPLITAQKIGNPPFCKFCNANGGQFHERHQQSHGQRVMNGRRGVNSRVGNIRRRNRLCRPPCLRQSTSHRR